MRPRLAAMGRSVAKHGGAAEVENMFSGLMPAGLLKRAATKEGSRNRIYGKSLTFWCFLWQVLHPDTACRAVVRKIQAQCETTRRRIASSNSAYCQARSRLPLEMFDQAYRHVAMRVEQMAGFPVPTWKRAVKVVDTTSCRLPDTPENARKYHYPTGQKKGCGFPVMRIQAIFSLASGVISEITTAACYTAEVVMFTALMPSLKPTDILLGDRAFGHFAILAMLPMQGVDVVARLNQGRNLDLRRAPKLGRNDWLVTLPKPVRAPAYISGTLWKKTPESIPVRVIRSHMAVKGFRTRSVTIVTTLLDAERYSRDDIAKLYLRRWAIELSFRDIKTTMGMEELRCRSPKMIEKELRMFLVAYNCIRALMVESAIKHHLSIERISFKGTVHAVDSFSSVLFQATSRRTQTIRHNRLITILAEDTLPHRPGRVEPRSIKRRPKPYPWLTSDRRTYKEAPHRGKRRATKRPQTIILS
jgi:hypothetical protein